jgi:adenylate cyclase
VKLRFRVTLLTLLVSLTLLTVLLVGSTAFYHTRRGADALARQVLQQTSVRIDQRVTALVRTATRQAAVTRELVRSRVLSPDDPARVAAYWVEVMEAHPELGNLYFTRDSDGSSLIVNRLGDGRLIVQEVRPDQASGRMTLRNYRPGDYPARPYALDRDRDDLDQRRWAWYGPARAGGRPYWSDTFVLFTDDGVPDTPGMTYALPVHGPDGALVGVLGVDFDVYGLCRFLKALEVSPNGYAFLVEQHADGSRNLIAHPDRDVLVRGALRSAEKRRGALAPLDDLTDRRVPAFMAQVPAGVDPSGVKDVTPVHFVEGGVSYLGTYRRLAGDDCPGWFICVVLPEEDVLGQIYHLRRVAAVIGLAALALSVILSMLVSEQVARPLERLAREAGAVGRLGVEPRPAVRSAVVEVDRLGRAVEEMKTGLRSFQKYVPADLVRALYASGREARLDGECRTLTIFFCDVADFTAISEGLSAEALVAQLGEYLQALSGEVVAAGGTVDKYIGDAVMAFWGAPAENPAHALAACIAALRGQKRLELLRGRWRAEGRPPFVVRMGLNTGPVVVGNIGSDVRLNYTVIGDPVNVASRLEGLNKYYGTDVLISDDTRQAAGDAVVARPVDWVTVKGKSGALLVHELLGLAGEAGPDALELAERAGQALACYRRQDWAGAIGLFEEVLGLRPADGPALRLMGRCQEYRLRPPGPDWDGVHRMESK